MAKYGTPWRTHANSHLSWRPEWLPVQHTWLTLLEPGHCPMLVPTLTTIAGRCVGAGCPPCPATSDTRHCGHPTRLTGHGVRAPSQSHRKGGSGSKGERGGESRAAQGAVSLGPARHPLRGTPEAKRIPAGNHPFPMEPVLTPQSQPSTSGRVSGSFWCRCQRSLDSFSWGSSHQNADVNLVVLCGTQVTSQ